MDRDLRKLLPNAKGQAQLVIAVNIDIRGFSAFSQKVESVEAATYLRRVYTRVLDDYLPPTTFFKLTGDGLLAVFVYETVEGLKSLAETVMEASFRLHDEFATIASHDSLMNFLVPEKVGIGIARGAASRIYAGNKTIDYSGRVLNLASRLMALARPSGIVVDGQFDLNLVAADKANLFKPAEVYLSGVAETTPITVSYTWEFTTIPFAALQPLDEPEWQTEQIEFTVRELDKMSVPFRHVLKVRPIDASRVTVTAQIPFPTAQKMAPGLVRYVRIADATYRLETGRPTVRFPVTDLLAKAKELKLRGTAKVHVTVAYPGHDATPQPVRKAPRRRPIRST